MTDTHVTVRDHMVDAAKASPIAGYMAAWVGGWTLENWATVLAIAYTLLLIFDKLRQMGVFGWVGRHLRRPP